MFKGVNNFLELEMNEILDIGTGGLQHTQVFLDSGKVVDICDYGNSVYYDKRIQEIIESKIRKQIYW